ncbi:hypothetical protein GYH30_006358 [Glycine max]|nr:hypothetical protein GYH30_006358 [Glycine max]
MAGPEVAIRSLNSNDTRGKTITCKAVVAYGPRGPFVVERVLVHPPQKMENEAQRAYPRIFGREASGIVESVREGVNDMKEGNLVVPIFNEECGDCKYCKCEKTNMCDGATRFSTTDGKPILHFLNTSTFTEYTVVDSACVVKIRVDGDGDLNPYIKRLTLLSCGVSTVFFSPI